MGEKCKHPIAEVLRLPGGMWGTLTSELFGVPKGAGGCKTQKPNASISAEAELVCTAFPFGDGKADAMRLKLPGDRD